MAKLALFLPDGTPMELPLNKERITIGRRADNDVCLQNLAVSGEHAAVVTILADSFLEDLRSTNGTLVNGKRVSKHFLRDGDEFDVGRHLFLYVEDEERVVEPRLASLIPRLATRNLGEQVAQAKAPARVASAKPEPVASSAKPEPDALATPEPVREPAAANVVPSTEGVNERTFPNGDAKGKAMKASVTRIPEEFRPTTDQLPALATLKMLSGARAGESIPLVKNETTLGRVGVQVVAIIATDSTFRLRRIEGTRLVSVNGQAVDGEDVDLHSGDVIELADTRIEFLGAQAEPIRASGT